ncbi:MAG: TetR/AcrR family transcriptional regulator [Thermoplasmatota archaeon]
MPRRRKYELKARAESQEETRRRIVEAAVALHEALGPAQTSISAIAERAGVQRLTVYRHFPSEVELLRACSGHYRALHPPPDPAAWKAIRDPEARLAAGLGALYRHYRETERLTANVLRDLEIHPILKETSEPRLRHQREARAILGEGWKGVHARSAIGHAIQFRTWQSLAAEGVDDEVAVDLMVRFVRAAVDPRGA